MAPVIYKRQKQILDFIRQHIQAYGYAPTLRQIADSIGVSSLATVHEHLESLEAKKLITRKPGRTRSIHLPDEVYSFQENYTEMVVPVLGFIAAGTPIEPYPDPNAMMNIPGTFASKNKRIYVLQVKGESMIEDHIRDGDNVVIEETSVARNGEIVVALLDNGVATLKRFYKEPKRIRLEPANSTMKPIFAKNVKIQGKLIGLIRKYSN